MLNELNVLIYYLFTYLFIHSLIHSFIHSFMFTVHIVCILKYSFTTVKDKFKVDRMKFQLFKLLKTLEYSPGDEPLAFSTNLNIPDCNAFPVSTGNESISWETQTTDNTDMLLQCVKQNTWKDSITMNWLDKAMEYQNKLSRMWERCQSIIVNSLKGDITVKNKTSLRRALLAGWWALLAGWHWRLSFTILSLIKISFRRTPLCCG